MERACAICSSKQLDISKQGVIKRNIIYNNNKSFYLQQYTDNSYNNSNNNDNTNNVFLFSSFSSHFKISYVMILSQSGLGLCVRTFLCFI